MENTTIKQDIRAVSGFSGLQFKAVGKILLTQGDTASLVIEAEPEVCSRIHTEVIDGILKITYDSDWKDWTGLRFVDAGPIIFRITMKEIRSIAVSGVGYLDSAAIDSDQLSISLSGPGSITVGHVNVKTLTSDLSGVGSIDIAGTCLDQTINLSGAGSYTASRLKSERAIVRLSGVGNATVWANASLDATISGAGAVEYYGSAQVSQKVSGIGMLKYLGNR